VSVLHVDESIRVGICVIAFLLTPSPPLTPSPDSGSATKGVTFADESHMQQEFTDEDFKYGGKEGGSCPKLTWVRSERSLLID